MRFIDAEATRRALPMPALIEALRRAFIAGAEVPPRGVHALGDAGTMLVMPAWRVGAHFGLKAVSIFPGNGARGLPGLHSVYLLFDATTGVPLAQIDGDEITSRRTAAAAALAASHLARADARRLLVLGTGRVASLLPEAFACVRPIDEVLLWNHRRASAEALAQRWRDAGRSVRVVDDLERAVREADLVSAATLSTRAPIHGAWLAPGAHLDLIGSFTPAMREADPAAFAASRVFVDTPEALLKAGDLLDAFAAGACAPDRVEGTLAALCRGEAEGRRGAGERTLFKAVGTALEDLAAAELVVAAPGGTDAPPGR